MTNKTFIVTLVMVMFWGGGIGGAFAAGLNVGQTRGENAVHLEEQLQSSLVPPTQNGDTQGLVRDRLDDLSPEQRRRLDALSPEQRRRLDNLSPEQRRQLMQRFAEGGGSGEGRTRTQQAQESALPGGVRLTGTLERIEGNIVTLRTAQGSLDVNLNDETNIFVSTKSNYSALRWFIGDRAIIAGQRADDGGVIVQSVTVPPEGVGSSAGWSR